MTALISYEKNMAMHGNATFLFAKTWASSSRITPLARIMSRAAQHGFGQLLGMAQILGDSR